VSKVISLNAAQHLPDPGRYLGKIEHLRVLGRRLAAERLVSWWEMGRLKRLP